MEISLVLTLTLALLLGVIPTLIYSQVQAWKRGDVVTWVKALYFLVFDLWICIYGVICLLTKIGAI